MVKCGVKWIFSLFKLFTSYAAYNLIFLGYLSGKNTKKYTENYNENKKHSFLTLLFHTVLTKLV